MKVIINNLMYDTSTSTALYVNGADVLYKTENGAYFLKKGTEIVPMTEDETKEYLGVNDADVYIKEFGEVELA